MKVGMAGKKPADAERTHSPVVAICYFCQKVDKQVDSALSTALINGFQCIVNPIIDCADRETRLGLTVTISPY